MTMRVDILRRERVLIALGVLLLIATLALMIVDVRAALGGWLGAATVFSAVSAGATYLVLTMRLIPGAWGEELRLSAEAGTLLTPFALAAFVPIMLGVGAIYPWAGGSASGEFKSLWLGSAAYAGRTIVRFVGLLWASHRMRSRRSTATTAAVALLVLPLLALVTSFDWLLSLDPEFASSGFGLQFLAREVLIAFAAMILLRLSVGAPPPRLSVTGGVLLTLLLLWAYLQFMPFLVSWSGNLPSSAEWYLKRAGGGWSVVAWAWAGPGLAAILLLLFPAPRSRPVWLKAISLLVLASQLVETAWVVLPAFAPLAIAAYLLGVTACALFCFGALPAALRHRVRARAPAKEGR
ncbi:hypothetical protein [Novosphingobium sp. M1R2S20]|uniref:Quinol:cytochrome c oxidoreductase quinone-binding subunit 2 n=1 Tax=Novosphingobium rhizovicinum TaxID=3228928 RepID=A0ABV3RGD7_9SPHN